jgi:hypothetical protein
MMGKFLKHPVRIHSRIVRSCLPRVLPELLSLRNLDSKSVLASIRSLFSRLLGAVGFIKDLNLVDFIMTGKMKRENARHYHCAEEICLW